MDIHRTASRDRIPVTVTGSLTGMTGGGVARGGWAISLEKFQRLEIQTGRAIAAPGVSIDAWQAAAGRPGQSYAPDPTERTASIGGTIATNASGSRSFRYGSTRRHVLGLRVALIDGRVLNIQRGDKIDFEVPQIPLPSTTKNTAGYLLSPGMDWIDLFAGSEGTLGIAIEAELRLLPKPADILAGVIFLISDDAALAVVEACREIPGMPMIDYFDRTSLDLLPPRYPQLPPTPTTPFLTAHTPPTLDHSPHHPT